MTLLQAITRVTQTFNDRRLSPRQHVQFPAWIDLGDGSQPRNCTVLDVSEGGARIMVEHPIKLSKEFYLVLTKQGTRRRRCRTVWRSDDQIGVTYLGPVESEHLLGALFKPKIRTGGAGLQ